MQSTAKVVQLPSKHPPIVKDTERPFRVWRSRERKYFPHRFYATERRAQDSTLVLIKYEKVDTTLEVLDVRTMKLLGTYRRGPNAIYFTPR